jgi:hypothetical protein
MQLGGSKGGLVMEGGDAGTSGAAAEGDATSAILLGDTCVAGTTASSSSSSSSSCSAAAGSSAGRMPPATANDVTVAANALLVACRAAGALLGVPKLLEQSLAVSMMHKLVPMGPEQLAAAKHQTSKLAGVLQNLAEWVVLLHPLLAQLLPEEQGQVLASLQERLVSGQGNSSTTTAPRSSRNSPSSSSSSSSRSRPSREVAQQEARDSSNNGLSNGLSEEEVTAVLGALQHVVIPGQPGCSNPCCCCLEGLSEGEMKTQVCAACRGARYCSAACQRAHWRAGHKEVCKAVQAATKAAAAADEAVVPQPGQPVEG